MSDYKHTEIEKKWQERWREKSDLYAAADDSDKPKKYILDMFPYPSAAGLHVGHVESYTATDIVSRYYRLKGFNVLHPQGWDAFGLPAENYAIKTGAHPDKITHENIKNFTRQIKSLGLSYDWSREIDTSDPEYYRWTQWFFLFLYKNGLAYKKKAKVNWCDSCKTVLANEQAEGGICERCKNTVMQKDLEQWFFKITDFIENNKNTTGLIKGLDGLDWPESIKAAQKNWIGRSEGAIIKFKVKSEKPACPAGRLKVNEEIEVFTTRLDTIYGCTYCVVAPEHGAISDLRLQIENIEEVEKYIEEAKNKTDLDRMEDKEKTGVELRGIKAINPFNKEEVPVFVADYVLGHYGTGAVMAVPAHDERDWDFAKKNGLDVKCVVALWPLVSAESSNSLEEEVIKAKERDKRILLGEEVYIHDGVLVNSSEYNELTSEKAREKMIEWLEKTGVGRKVVNYRLRDWLVSRQRYWGAPIPIIYCEKCGEVPVPEKDLPVVLPTDVDFKPTGESPLAQSKSFHEVKCPECGRKAKRESDTMDTFVCSSWYYLRYADPKNNSEFAGKEKIKKWLPVDLYVGGAEHAVLHLLYARFFTKALHSFGHIDFDEPFLKLRNQGMILAEDGRKMSKSLGNVVNPDDAVAGFGADSLRMFEMFMGPLEDAKPWNTQGIVGIKRFLEKVWSVFHDKGITNCDCAGGVCKNAPEGLPRMMHQTIKKVTEDIEGMRFNTAISQMMIFVNFIAKLEKIPRKALEYFLILLSPFAPHIAEELWEGIHKEIPPTPFNERGQLGSIFKAKWPEYDPALIKDEIIQLVLQVNGKVRDMIEVSADMGEEEAVGFALQNEKVKKWTEDKEIVKKIFVKNKLVNIVVK